ncbi:MAG: hypothetical protein R2867_15950 [Caldilineaceae bacterium]
MVNKTGDATWLYCDLEITKVDGGGSSGHRWSYKEIIDGKHFDVYERHLNSGKQIHESQNKDEHKQAGN